MLPLPGKSPAGVICLHVSQILSSISPLSYDIGSIPATTRSLDSAYSDLQPTYLAQTGQRDMLGSRGTVSRFASSLRPTLDDAHFFLVFLGNATGHTPSVMLPPPPLLLLPDISDVSFCHCTMAPPVVGS